MMPTRRFTPARVALRPARVLVTAALVPALTGCATATSLTYSGTASVQASDSTQQALAHDDVSLTSCAGIRSSGQEPQTFAVLRVGDCTVVGQLRGADFLTEGTGQVCTLPMAPGAGAEVRVTDVGAWLGWVPGRYPSVDPARLTVRMGGEANGSPQAPRHLLYEFSGTARSARKARAVCDAIAAERLAALQQDPKANGER